MSSDAPAGIDLSGVFGPVYWGFVVSLLLGGITIVQAYIYFMPASNNSRSTDRIEVQAIAATMFLFDIVSSGLVAQSIYYYLLPSFGALEQFGSVTPTLSAECLLSTTITLISQMYFIHQLRVVHHLGKVSWAMIVAIGICTFFAFAGGVACVAAMLKYRHGVLSNRNDIFVIFFGVAKGFGAAADILATIAMCLTLQSSKTNWNYTNDILRKLIQYVIQRGVLVTLIQTLLLITFYAMPNNLIWFAIHVNVTKLYANTFFAMLNGREQLKDASAKPSFVTSSSHVSRNRIDTAKFDHGYDMEVLAQTDSKQGLQMPTVTKTVITS